MAEVSAERQRSRDGRNGGMQHASAILRVGAGIEFEHGAMRTASSQHVRAAVFAHDEFCSLAGMTRSIAAAGGLEHEGGFVG
jgi:hypothetical protein